MGKAKDEGSGRIVVSLDRKRRNAKGLLGAMPRKGENGKWISFGVMLEAAAPFAQQVPAMATALRETNDRRSRIPDSHPFEFKTGQKTKHLKVRERDSIKLDLTGVYRDTMDFLDALP